MVYLYEISMNNWSCSPVLVFFLIFFFLFFFKILACPIHLVVQITVVENIKVITGKEISRSTLPMNVGVKRIFHVRTVENGFHRKWCFRLIMLLFTEAFFKWRKQMMAYICVRINYCTSHSRILIVNQRYCMNNIKYV